MMIIIILLYHLYVKDPNEAKYHYHIKKHEKNGRRNIKYSNNMQDVYKNIEEYYPSRKCNVLIVFDDC